MVLKSRTTKSSSSPLESFMVRYNTVFLESKHTCISKEEKERKRNACARIEEKDDLCGTRIHTF
jgi:hypothetical protein